VCVVVQYLASATSRHTAPCRSRSHSDRPPVLSSQGAYLVFFVFGSTSLLVTLPRTPSSPADGMRRLGGVPDRLHPWSTPTAVDLGVDAGGSVSTASSSRAGLGTFEKSFMKLRRILALEQYLVFSEMLTPLSQAPKVRLTQAAENNPAGTAPLSTAVTRYGRRGTVSAGDPERGGRRPGAYTRSAPSWLFCVHDFLFCVCRRTSAPSSWMRPRCGR